MNCTNCDTEIHTAYCPNCGQPAHVKRINSHYLVHEIEHVLHFEKGILFTIRELLTRPGENVRRFISENRSRLVKPIIFIIVTSLVYSLVSHFFHIESSTMQVGEAKPSAADHIMKWVQDHYGYSNIIMGVFIAQWIRLFFRKYDYNVFEILILLCFVMGMGMLFSALFAIIQGLTHIGLTQVGSFVGVVYCTWAIGQFFDKKKAASYLKAFAAYVLGMITFMLIVILLGASIDLILA
ncbi:hypothetical protein C7T94_10875 [Pedobacter yulinensis]|uniref:DUF3667 domain-containing protein n=1 Tax=Pedobacter yulinensis TaxID=2126353 RepID=A0A2T3HKX1_9SPHI|nr:DUF3667 domain-containing protein [Pedobacter yulinensis]PST83108.1 hypothetical protein C7T94_10875 [Pedobacter yulinensis]